MVKKAHLPPSLSRKSSRIEPKLTLYVFCEGKNTEPFYLKEFAQAWGNKLVKVIPSGAAGVPYTLVSKACEKKVELDRLAKRSKDSFSNKFAVWGVFDVDEHPRIMEAKELAHKNNVGLCISNPCIELWGMLHFSNHDAPIHRHDAQRKLVVLMPSYDPNGSKIFDYNLLHEKYNDAKIFAKRLLVNREQEDSVGGNPSTDLFYLLDLIIENGQIYV